MQWLADECVFALVVARLRELGHDVLYMAETSPGSNDDAVAALAAAGGRLLLTRDTDFGEIAFRRRQAMSGIVLLRLDPSTPLEHWNRLDRAIRQFDTDLFGRFTVIGRDRIRWRPLLTIV